jgi:hypothetical protein
VLAIARPLSRGRPVPPVKPQGCDILDPKRVSRRLGCEENEIKIKLTETERNYQMSKNESTLTTALAAAQARISVRASTNPIGLSENLVRQTEIPEIDFAAETSQALDTLEAAVVDYQGREGTVNQPLVDARQSVVLLETQLTEARAKLRELESKGSFLDQLNQAVLLSERRVEGLVNHYSKVVTDELMQIRYGQKVNFAALGSEAKRDLRMHVRLTDLKQFHISGRGNFDHVTPEYLFQRAEKTANTLDALRQHIAQDQANAKQ